MGYAHGTAWSEELIREKILEVVSGLELDRMPSRKEVEFFCKNGSLSNAISRNGGWYHWAEKLCFDVKESETWLGKRHEKEIQEVLISLGYETARMSQNFPYDLLVDGCIKIDVKASKLYRGVAGSFYSVNLEKAYSTCDIYIIRLLSDDGKAEKTLVLPSKFVAAQTQISIGEKSSKYYRFLDRWDYIESYSSFLESVV